MKDWQGQVAIGSFCRVRQLTIIQCEISNAILNCQIFVVPVNCNYVFIETLEIRETCFARLAKWTIFSVTSYYIYVRSLKGYISLRKSTGLIVYLLTSQPKTPFLFIYRYFFLLNHCILANLSLGRNNMPRHLFRHWLQTRRYTI